MTTATVDLPGVIEKLNKMEEQLRQMQILLRTSESAAGVTTETEHPYITQVDGILSGEPIIKGTRTPVRAIVEYWKFGDAPEVIASKLPQMRLAQIFDALSYYDDHRTQIEHYIALNRVPVDD